MKPYITAVLTLSSLVFALLGCTSEQVVSSRQLEQGETGISAVLTTDRTRLMFEKVGGQYATLRDTTMIGLVTDGGAMKAIRVPVAQVDSAVVDRPDAGKTVALVFLGIPMAVIGLAMALYAISPR